MIKSKRLMAQYFGLYSNVWLSVICTAPPTGWHILLHQPHKTLHDYFIPKPSNVMKHSLNQKSEMVHF